MVNDFTVSALGSEKPVGESLPRALPAPCKRFRDMEVSVSRQKCQIAASPSMSAQVLGAVLQSLNFKVCAGVKNLGHDFSQQAGKRWAPQ
eukprot:799061-Pyramimonas_sp.AAC.1